MPRSRSAAGTASGSWSGCSCANCNKKRSVGLRAEDIELLAEDIADLLDQGALQRARAPSNAGCGAVALGSSGGGRFVPASSACLSSSFGPFMDLNYCQFCASMVEAASLATLPCAPAAGEGVVASPCMRTRCPRPLPLENKVLEHAPPLAPGGRRFPVRGPPRGGAGHALLDL